VCIAGLTLTERPKNPNWKRGLNPQRIWTHARRKVQDEGRCRRCHSPYRLDPAHIIPRSRIGAQRGAEAPENILPLCRTCHDLYDMGRLDLRPFLTEAEWAHARLLVGEGEAERRLSPSTFRQESEAA
jgi:hypothetical protein